jgi:UDP-N-acetylglucosamine transferase subunit ALG13
VGNDFRDFSRLIKEVDEIAIKISDEIVIQRGYSRYHPKNTRNFDFVPIITAIEYIKTSELVISHAGIGTIILCKEYGIPLIIVPRRKKYNEHMNDHQMEIAKVLEEKGEGGIHVIYEEDQLEKKIIEILGNRKRQTPIRNIGRERLIRMIREFIERGVRK